MKLKSDKELLYCLSIIGAHIDDHLRNNNSIKTGLISAQASNMCADGTRISVTIADKNVSKKPFVMCIYPEPSELEEMNKPLVKALHHDKFEEFIDTWSGIKLWHIEIDERTITKGHPICVDSGRQFCALLCHELNHAVYTHPIHLVMNYKINKARMDAYSKMLSDKKSVGRLFLPMFVCVDGLRIVLSKPCHTAQEMQADLHVPNEYKQDMIMYMENHVISNPLIMSDTIKSNEEFDNEQNTGVMFTAECIRQMKQRRSMVKMQLEAQYKLQPNGYFKDVLARTIEGISGKEPVHESSNIVRENQFRNRMQLVKETACNKQFKADIEATDKEFAAYQYTLESRIIDERDIIMLTVESDNISDAQDKNYVLNLCFDYLDALNKQRQKLLNKTKESDPKKLAEITKDVDSKITRVNSIISSTMNKKVTYSGDHYGLFIKYPAGYEG